MVVGRTVRMATRESVITFLKERKQAVQSEIIRLGGKSATIDYRSFLTIVGDLEQEGKVRRVEIQTRSKGIILYEWIGGSE